MTAASAYVFRSIRLASLAAMSLACCFPQFCSAGIIPTDGSAETGEDFFNPISSSSSFEPEVLGAVAAGDANFVYDPSTGNLSVEVGEGLGLLSLVTSPTGIFRTENFPRNAGGEPTLAGLGTPTEFGSNQITYVDFGNPFAAGIYEFGALLPTNIQFSNFDTPVGTASIISDGAIVDGVPQDIQIFLGFQQQGSDARSVGLSVVPEPSSLMFLMLGFVAILKRNKP